ncbi:pilus assembly protein TadG-related protein [Brachybacterium huguangmaarense]
MTRPVVAAPRGEEVARHRLRDDQGTMTILLIGVLVVILMIVGVGVAITSVQLERNELQSMADGAALASSQAFSESSIYAGTNRTGDGGGGGPAGGAPAVDRAEAERTARAYLRAYPSLSTRLRDVRVVDVSVSPDGAVSVELAARTDPALVGWVTRRTDLSFTIRASGTGRAR